MENKKYIFVLSFLLLLFKVSSINNPIKEKKLYAYFGTDGLIEAREEGEESDSLAYANYRYAYETEGWDYLTVSSNTNKDSNYKDMDKTYAMGYLEGILSSEQIAHFYENLNALYFKDNGGKMPDDVYDYFKDNLDYVEEEVILNELKGGKNIYWNHAGYVFSQLRGLVDGYNDNIPQGKAPIDIVEFQVMTAFGDLDDIPYYKKSNRPNFKNMTGEEILNYVSYRSHCSALIKMADDFSDIWMGHNSWFSYNTMIRIFKEYRFVSNDDSVKGKTVAFSSYPGVLASNDDFYLTSADLYVMETTNSVYNMDIYDKITPKGVLTWMKVIIANRLSSTPEEWVQIFKKYNTGTYNNQYQILDLKRVDLEKKTMENNAFLIVEQLPGNFRQNYETRILKRGYWPSYNIPFFEDMIELAGYPQLFKEHPELIKIKHHFMGSRPSIFRRDHVKVNSIEDYKDLLTSNNYKTEPFVYGSPKHPIAARYDLDPNDPSCFGMTDVKFFAASEVIGKPTKKIYLYSGPSKNKMDPFDWTKATCKDQPGVKHEGQVDLFNFDWVVYETKLF